MMGKVRFKGELSPGRDCALRAVSRLPPFPVTPPPPGSISRAPCGSPSPTFKVCPHCLQKPPSLPYHLGHPETWAWKGVHMTSVLCYQRVSPLERPVQAVAENSGVLMTQMIVWLLRGCKDVGFGTLLQVCGQSRAPLAQV